jgi:phosphoribosylformylglycinamidine cyclo-ligase
MTTSREPRVLTYDRAGVEVSHEESNLRGLGRWISETFALNDCRPMLPLGYFANVLRLSPELGLAISTDGVGTKLLIAQLLESYDTVGIDCVAMNANDILCVGALPIAMVDYIATEKADPVFLGDVARGLFEGARRAGINIPGGEVAQVSEMIRGAGTGLAFDLVGTCVGTVHPDRLIVGRDVEPGDVVVGIESSGIHSNGLTLARRVLLDDARLQLTAHVAELGRPLGDELLEPTHIYVPEVREMMSRRLRIKALIHITSDGFLNLLRVANQGIGYVLDALPEPPPIFPLIQRTGGITDAEMFRVFNMGIGFCIVVARADSDEAIGLAKQHGRRAWTLGYAVADPERRVWMPARRLVGQGLTFSPESSEPPPCP